MAIDGDDGHEALGPLPGLTALLLMMIMMMTPTRLSDQFFRPRLAVAAMMMGMMMMRMRSWGDLGSNFEARVSRMFSVALPPLQAVWGPRTIRHRPWMKSVPESSRTAAHSHCARALAEGGSSRSDERPPRTH